LEGTQFGYENYLTRSEGCRSLFLHASRNWPKTCICYNEISDELSDRYFMINQHLLVTGVVTNQFRPAGQEEPPRKAYLYKISRI